MITPITATFPALNFPKEVDYPTQEDWAAFSAAAELNYGILSGAWSDKSEEFKAQTNNLAQEIQDIGENAINAITFDNIAQLKLNSNIGRVDVLGYYIKGDGGGGLFYWDSTSTEADNGGTIIQATGITTGRWKRVFSGAVNVKWFGANTVRGDNEIPIQATIDYAISQNNCIIIPDGTFITTGKINTKGCAIEGSINSIISSTSSDYILYTTYDKMLNLKNLKIEGDRTKVNQHGLYQDLDNTGVWHSRSHTFENLEVINCGLDGIHLTNGCEITNFESVIAYRCGRNGIRILGNPISDSPIEYLNFNNCKFHYNGEENMYFQYIKKHVTVYNTDLSASGWDYINNTVTPVTTVASMIPAIKVVDSPFGLGAGSTTGIRIKNCFLENATVLLSIKASTTYGGTGDINTLLLEDNIIYPFTWAIDGTGEIYSMVFFNTVAYLNNLHSSNNSPRAGYHYFGTVTAKSSNVDTTNELHLNVPSSLDWIKTKTISNLVTTTLTPTTIKHRNIEVIDIGNGTANSFTTDVIKTTHPIGSVAGVPRGGTVSQFTSMWLIHANFEGTQNNSAGGYIAVVTVGRNSQYNLMLIPLSSTTGFTSVPTISTDGILTLPLAQYYRGSVRRIDNFPFI